MSTEDQVEVKEIVEQIFEAQVQLFFSSIAEEFDVESGDITPFQSFTLSAIADKMSDLAVEYVVQNNGSLQTMGDTCRNGKDWDDCQCC